jgi:hypothetical protein
MKGLIISLLTFVLYIIITALLAHTFKPRHIGKLFFPSVVWWSPIYFVLYYLTPSNVYFLPESWLTSMTWLDVSYGYVVYLLNCHSYIDFFFGFNGGFSMSLMFEIFRAPGQRLKKEILVKKYYTDEGLDKIYSWRLPHLLNANCIVMNDRGDCCKLTDRGRRIAIITKGLKRFLNLSEGG